jgi:hypothetical protein
VNETDAQTLAVSRAKTDTHSRREDRTPPHAIVEVVCDSQLTTPSMTKRYDHRCEDESSSETKRITFRSRRRRKRPRPSILEGRRARQEDRNGKGKQIATKDSESLLCNFPLPRSLPFLLYRRGTGENRRVCSLWQADNSSKPSTLIRSIRYSQLRTPPSEAVLALERNGSYFVSLSGNTNTTERSPLLSLRLYGKITGFPTSLC